MKEDSNLLKKYGKKMPFNTPEGYFDRFTEQLMEQLPRKEEAETPKISMWDRIKPWIYMTAMFCGLMFGIRVIMGDKQTDSYEGAMENISDLPEEYIEPIVEQTMMDDYTLYQYLTDANISIYQ